MSNNLLMILIVLIAGANACEIANEEPDYEPTNGKLITCLSRRASVYEISKEVEENASFFEDHEDKVMLQMQIDDQSPDLEALQKLMQKRDYEKIVRLMVKSYFVDENIVSDSGGCPDQEYWRRQKNLFWSEGNRSFSEPILQWILSHVKNDLKRKIFSFAAKADLPRFCEEIPQQMRYDADSDGADIDEDCPICKDEMVEGRVITPCKHKFHGDCLKPWADDKGSCPLCREDLTLQPDSFFIEAVKANSTKCIVKIMKKMSNFEVDFRGTTQPLNALQYIAAEGRDLGKMCEVLLQNGMKSLIEKPHAYGWDDHKFTPLMRAIYSSNPNVLRCLIRHRANLNARVALPGDWRNAELTPRKLAKLRMILKKGKDLERKSEEVFDILLSSNA